MRGKFGLQRDDVVLLEPRRVLCLLFSHRTFEDHGVTATMYCSVEVRMADYHDYSLIISSEACFLLLLLVLCSLWSFGSFCLKFFI